MCLSLEENRVDEIVQDALNLQRSPKASAREGLLWLLTFLPSVVGEIFAVYIGHTLPVVLAGLSDDSEGVREVALRAGQVQIIENFLCGFLIRIFLIGVRACSRQKPHP